MLEAEVLEIVEEVHRLRRVMQQRILAIEQVLIDGGLTTNRKLERLQTRFGQVVDQNEASIAEAEIAEINARFPGMMESIKQRILAGEVTAEKAIFEVFQKIKGGGYFADDN